MDAQCGSDPDHAEKMHGLPDEYLADAMPVAKKIAMALGVENYNILQNNGRIAHQVDLISVSCLQSQQAMCRKSIMSTSTLFQSPVTRKVWSLAGPLSQWRRRSCRNYPRKSTVNCNTIIHRLEWCCSYLEME